MIWLKVGAYEVISVELMVFVETVAEMEGGRGGRANAVEAKVVEGKEVEKSEEATEEVTVEDSVEVKVKVVVEVAAMQERGSFRW